MSIYKMTSSGSRSMDSLCEAHDYITDSDKTRKDLIGTRGCSPGTWVESSRSLKHQYHKEHKKMYRHGVLGFDDTDNLTPEDAKLVGDEVAKIFERRYVEYAVHTNTPHLHIHFLLCNTDYKTGRQISISDSDLEAIKNKISKILKSKGYSGVRMNSGFVDSNDGENGCFLEIEDEAYINANAIFKDEDSDSNSNNESNMSMNNMQSWVQPCYYPYSEMVYNQNACLGYGNVQNSQYPMPCNDTIRIELTRPPEPEIVFSVTPFTAHGDGQTVYFINRQEAEAYADDLRRNGFGVHYYTIVIAGPQMPFGSNEKFLM